MKGPVVICDSCKKLKLKCGWDRSPSFQPACARCQTYGLPCLFGGSTWTAAAVKEVVASFPGAPSRRLFWGAASNAGGHPLDLHREAPPPPPQPHTQQAGFARPLSPGPGVGTVGPGPRATTRPVTGRIRLLINFNMRAHLYDVFFTHIQPVVSVVTRQSLAEGTVPTLLDAAILGLAARHHLSISSTRDFLHIRDVILDELKATLCNFRRRYVPQTQTVQALLILLLQLELCTRTHDDLPSISLRVALTCRMAQDLGFHRAFDGDDYRESNDLSQNIWAMCVYVDTVNSAAFGQTAHIAASVTEGLADHLYRRAKTLLEAADATQEGIGRQEMMARARFLHLVGLICGLRRILQCFFSVNPSRNTPLRDQAAATLHIISDLHAQSEGLMHAHLDAYDPDAALLLRLLAANNRVLYAVGLCSVLPGDDPLVLATTMSLVDDACQIVEWTTPTVLRTPMGQLLVVLYATSRALMVVVDALRGARWTRRDQQDRRDSAAVPAVPAAQVTRLKACMVHAASLMEFLLRSGSWSAFWTQGHTIQAILARLEQDDGGSDGQLLPQATVGENSAPVAIDHSQPVPVGHGFPITQTGSAGIIYASMPMMNPSTPPAVDSSMANMGNMGNTGSMFPSTNWDDFFFNYVQEYGWLAQPGFAGDNNDGDMFADYVFEDNNV